MQIFIKKKYSVQRRANLSKVVHFWKVFMLMTQKNQGEIKGNSLKYSMLKIEL